MGGGGGWCLMMEYVYAGVERGVPMGRTHTGRTYTGGMNWGTGAVNWCTAQGLGGLERRRTCRRWGEREGKMMICGRACREPPTTLTASCGRPSQIRRRPARPGPPSGRACCRCRPGRLPSLPSARTSGPSSEPLAGRKEREGESPDFETVNTGQDFVII